MPRYRIVPERSEVVIDARSNVHPIHSRSDGLEGFIDLEIAPDGGVDLTAGPSGRLSFSVSRLSSGNRLEDREMQKRVDARRFPTIDGVLDKMERSTEGSSYRVQGDVIFKGIAHNYEDVMTFRAIDDRTIELSGKSRFDIRDFGMEPPRVLMLRVEPEVDVSVDIVAVLEA